MHVHLRSFFFAQDLKEEAMKKAATEAAARAWTTCTFMLASKKHLGSPEWSNECWMILNDRRNTSNFDRSNARLKLEEMHAKRRTVKCCTKCWIEMCNRRSTIMIYIYNIIYILYISIYYDPKEGSRSCLGLGTKSWRSLTSFAQITRLKVMSLHHDARREELGRG